MQKVQESMVPLTWWPDHYFIIHLSLLEWDVMLGRWQDKIVRKTQTHVNVMEEYLGHIVRCEINTDDKTTEEDERQGKRREEEERRGKKRKDIILTIRVQLLWCD